MAITDFRQGMYPLVEWLRDSCMISVEDYTILGAQYWTDDTIAKILQRNMRFAKRVWATPIPTVIGGTTYYYEYQLPYKNFESYESGTPYFRLSDAEGDTIGTADYTLDSTNGIIYFSEDTAGSARYADLTLYNLGKTASSIWRLKAAHISEHSYDVKLGDHNLSRNQRVQLYMEMANYYERSGGFTSVPVVRTDIIGV